MKFEGKVIPKRDSALHRAVGSHEEDRYWVLEEAKDDYQSPPKEVLFAHTEELPREAQELIRFIDSKLPSFLGEYGLREAVEITPDHFESADSSREKYRNSTADGHYDEHYMKIGLERVNWDNDPMAFAACSVHEMIHMQSFQSVTIKKHEIFPDESVVRIRRSGLGVVGEKEVFFNYLNEAIVEELTKRFMEQYADSLPYVEVDFESWLELEKMEGAEKRPDGFFYYHARMLLNELIDGLYTKQQSAEFSQEEIFKLFSRAALNGNLLSAARLVESVHGKGAFRKIGKIDFPDIETN